MSAASGEWGAVLDRLEADLDAVERQLSPSPTGDAPPAPPAPLAPPEAWTPPVVAGPLPAPLRARAETVLARQRDVAEQLAAALSATGRQRALTHSLGRTFVPPSGPVYLDVTA